MQLLKLIALDKEDLSIISAYLQDAVLKAADLTYLAAEKRFVLVANRFVWEEAGAKPRSGFERRRTALHFDRVEAVRSRGFNPQEFYDAFPGTNGQPHQIYPDMGFFLIEDVPEQLAEATVAFIQKN